MTTINEARQAIYDTFVTGWSGQTPFTFDNEEFDADAEGGDSWVRVTVRHLGSKQRTLGREGNRRFDRFASVIVQVYTTVDEGTESSDALVDDVKDIFEGKSIDTNATEELKLYESDVQEAGVDGRWYQVNVETGFFYEEKK